MIALVSRIFIVWLSGFLMASGWINDEIQQMLLTDPEFATAIQAALSALAMGGWLAFWRIAKRLGWAT
jgi:hypothetical protein